MALYWNSKDENGRVDMSIYRSENSIGLSRDVEKLSMRERSDGRIEIIGPNDQPLPGIYDRKDAEIVLMTPALFNACFDKEKWSRALAYALDHVLGICEQPGSVFAWRHMQRTADEIKEAIEQQNELFERWRARLTIPRCVPLHPFDQAGEDILSWSFKNLELSGSPPPTHTLTDDDIEVIQTWVPDFKPGEPVLHELKVVLMNEMIPSQSASQVRDLEIDGIITLLRRNPPRGSGAASGVTAPNNKKLVMYAWQSDLPDHLYQTFIEKALRAAATKVEADLNIEIQIDQDTQGIPGSPDIFNAIQARIDNADVFVCDVSIVALRRLSPLGSGESEPIRGFINPNVGIELGYALASRGDRKTIMVFNEASGSTQALPFDLGKKRQVLYQASGPPDEERGIARAALAKKLEDRLLEILGIAT